MEHFNSLDFLLFFLIVLGATQWAPARRGVLGFFCLFFLAAATNEYVAVGVVVVAIVYYFLGQLLRAVRREATRGMLLGGGLVTLWTIAVPSARYDWMQLAGEKAIDWLPLAFQGLLRSVIVVWSWRLGISFLALRITSYLVESLYRRERIPIGTFLLYLFSFPAYTAGPIERPWNFNEKLKNWKKPTRGEILKGLDRSLTGLFKKFVLADMLSDYAIDHIGLEMALTGQLWLALGAYSLFIYWEFSGYTDIAIGISRCLGIELPENFDRPYWKSDLSQFWQSWHISFSSWLRDYIFSPVNLLLNRRLSLSAIWVPVLGLLLTMAACGLWHGYTLGFLLWGLHHGIGLSVHRVYQSLMARRLGRQAYALLTQRRSYLLLCWLGTVFYVSLGWVWFVFPVEQAGQVFGRLFGME